MAQYKDGDSRQINGVTYVRQNGQWLPQGGAMGPAIGGNPLIPGQLQGQGLNNAGQATHNQRDAATLPFDIRKAKADAIKAEADARAAEEANPPTALVTNPGLSGADYLKTLPIAEQRLVQAMADGRLIPPTGKAAASPYWQKLIGQTLQYDPSFDAIDYGARYNTRKDFTSGVSSRNIKALNTAIGHVAQLADQIGGTASHGGFPLATTLNRAENAYSRGAGDPGVTKFTQTAGAVASELTQVFRGSGGAEADVQRYLSELDPNASAEQKNAAISNILGLLKSRLDALTDQYQKGMGNASAGLDVLDDHSKQALAKYLPGFTPPSAPNQPPPSGLGPNPGSADYSGVGGPQSGGIGGVDTSLRDVARGQTRAEFDPKWTGFVDSLVRNKVPYREAQEQISRRFPNDQPLSPTIYNKWLRYLNDHPSYKGGISYGTKQVPMTLGERSNNFVSSSVPGAAVGHFANDFTAGLPELAAGDQGAYFNAISRQQHPYASTAGDIGGTVAGALTVNKLLGPLLSRAPGAVGSFFNAAKAAPEATPGSAAARQARVTDTLFGGASGAVHNPDHPLAGAAGGAAAMGAGSLVGRYTLGPALQWAGDTTAGQFLANTALKGVAKVRGMFGGSSTPSTFNPPAALNPGESMILNQANKSGLGSIRANLNDAASLNLPYSLADADPRLRLLAGSATRKSPNVRQYAEDTIGPRQMGQAERAVGLIDSQLAPVGDVPTIKADALARARMESAPLYASAKAQTAPDLSRELGLSEVLSRPSAEQALRRGYKIALDEGANPAELSFATGSKGETIINGNPSWQTLHYVRRGLDEEIASAVDPVTGKVRPGMSDTQGAMIKLRGDLDKQFAQLNPTFKEADSRFSDFAGQGTAAERGAAAASDIRVTPDRTQAAIDSSPSDLAFFRRGYASSMADAVGRARLRADPYDVVYGSPHQQQKLGIVFPEGSARFARARQLESDMSKTHYETLGGSPTASRIEADKMFEGPGGMAADIALSAATGAPTPSLVARGLRGMNDWWQLGRGAKRADEIGQLLLDPDPRVAAAALRFLERTNGTRQGYVQNTRALGGMFGAPLTYGVAESR